MSDKPPAKSSRAIVRAAGNKPSAAQSTRAASKPAAATPKATAARKTAAAQTSNGARGASDAELRSPFTAEELAEWRRLLLKHRQEISTDIAHLERDAIEAENGHIAPNHMAERGSDAEIQDLSLGIAGDEHAVLWQIDRALRKIDTGQPLPFGLCEYTKQPIPKARLQLIPWTPLSIEGMQYVEENGLTVQDVLIDG